MCHRDHICQARMALQVLRFLNTHWWWQTFPRINSADFPLESVTQIFDNNKTIIYLTSPCLTVQKSAERNYSLDCPRLIGLVTHSVTWRGQFSNLLRLAKLLPFTFPWKQTRPFALTFTPRKPEKGVTGCGRSKRVWMHQKLRTVFWAKLCSARHRKWVIAIPGRFHRRSETEQNPCVAEEFAWDWRIGLMR